MNTQHLVIAESGNWGSGTSLLEACKQAKINGRYENVSVYQAPADLIEMRCNEYGSMTYKNKADEAEGLKLFCNLKGEIKLEKEQVVFKITESM